MYRKIDQRHHAQLKPPHSLLSLFPRRNLQTRPPLLTLLGLNNLRPRPIIKSISPTLRILPHPRRLLPLSRKIARNRMSKSSMRNQHYILFLSIPNKQSQHLSSFHHYLRVGVEASAIGVPVGEDVCDAVFVY